RVVDALPHGRRHRRRARLVARPAGGRRLALARDGERDRRAPRARHVDQHRPRVRYLPGHACGAPRSDRRAAFRVAAMIHRGMLGEILKMAWASLRANLLRSALTVVGVVIGVSTVIAMVSLIQGLNDSFKRQVQSFGSNTIYIRKWRPQVFIGELPDS